MTDSDRWENDYRFSRPVPIPIDFLLLEIKNELIGIRAALERMQPSRTVYRDPDVMIVPRFQQPPKDDD